MEVEDEEVGGELTPSIGIDCQGKKRLSSSVLDKLGLLCGIFDRGLSTKK